MSQKCTNFETIVRINFDEICQKYSKDSRIVCMFQFSCRFAFLSTFRLSDRTSKTCKLYSRDFWIFLPNIIKILSYTVSKLVHFLRHSICCCVFVVTIRCWFSKTCSCDCDAVWERVRHPVPKGKPVVRGMESYIQGSMVRGMSSLDPTPRYFDDMDL